MDSTKQANEAVRQARTEGKANGKQARTKFLTFWVEDTGYAMDITYVQEIINIQAITELPNTKPYVKGVMNLRGSVIPVIDAHLRFGFHEREYDARTSIIVVKVKGLDIGLIVDKVAAVVDVPKENIEPSHGRTGEQNTRFIAGMAKLDGKIRVVLDMERFFFDENGGTAGE